MPLDSNAIHYSTIIIIAKARELVKTCLYADKCLGEVLQHLPNDNLMTEKQRQVVTGQAVSTREVLQKSINLFGQVIKIWEVGCNNMKTEEETKDA